MTDILTNNDLSNELGELLNSVNHTIPIKKGQYLFQEGMAAEEIYIVRSGKVQVSKVSPDGRELSLRICTSGDILGELAIFSDDPKYMLSAKILEDGEAAVIKKPYLEEQLLKNSALAYEFMKWLSNHFRKTQTKFRDLVLHGKKGALFSTLIRLSNSYGIKEENGDILLDITLTNQELANFCGTSRESVNRLLSDLRKHNIISNRKGKIVLHDLDYLKREINCENCSVDLCNIE